MLRSVCFGLLLGLCCVPTALAETAPTSLEGYFTGKMVVAKIDMPGTEKGVDLDFDKPAPLDWKDYSSRLTSCGVAIHKGDTAQVTKVVVKKDSIEFQLNGGGYGTVGESTKTKVAPKKVSKSGYEKDLEKQISKTKDPAQKQTLQDNLDKEAARREREDTANEAAALAATQVNEKGLADKRRHGGSRFNLRFKGSVPGDDKSPDGVMKLLADYVEFKSN